MLDFDKGKQSNQFRYPINVLVCRLKLLLYTEFNLFAAEDLVFFITLVTNPRGYVYFLLCWIVSMVY